MMTDDVAAIERELASLARRLPHVRGSSTAGRIDVTGDAGQALATLAGLCQVATSTGNRSLGEQLRMILLPYAGWLVPAGDLAAVGPLAGPLGLLCESLDRFDEAERLLRIAIEVCTELEARRWLAAAQVELATFYQRQGTHLATATALLTDALRTATALGAGPLAQLAQHALAGPGIGHVRVLGAFEVVAVDGQAARWPSRKARDLLKMLVAARGSPVPREACHQELWPGAEEVVLPNRFAVTVSAVRRTLDPERTLPHDHFVVVDGPTIRLRVERLDVDVETFLHLVRSSHPEAPAEAVAIHRGIPFAEDPTAEWAAELRHEVELAFSDVAHRLARQHADTGQHAAAAALYGRIVEADPYNEVALTAMIASLEAVGAQGAAEDRRRQLAARRGELAVTSRIVGP